MARVAAGAALLVSVVLGDVSRAAACSEPPCDRGIFVPGDDTNIPAGAPALVWYPAGGRDGADTGDVSLEWMASDGTFRPLTLVIEPADRRWGRHVQLPAGLIAGVYRATVPSTCFDEEGGTATRPQLFTVGATAPWPAALGAMSAEPPVLHERGGGPGPCGGTEPVVTIAVAVTLDPTAQPWLHLLRFTTRVDGRPWPFDRDFDRYGPDGPPVHVHGPGHDVIESSCAEDALRGRHAVSMEAHLPGDEQVWLSDEIEIEIVCPGDAPVPADAAMPDPGTPDAGGARPRVPAMSPSVCGCVAAGAAPSTCLPLLAFGVALGGALVSRRRRKSSPRRAA